MNAYASLLLSPLSSLPLASKENSFSSYVTLMLLWAVKIKQKKKKQKIKKGGWSIYFGKRKKEQRLEESERGMKGTGARGMVGLSRVLGWELRVSERKIFRSCSIHVVGM